MCRSCEFRVKLGLTGSEVRRGPGKVYYPIVGQDFQCGLENPLIESAH